MLIRMGMGTQLSGSVGGVVASHNKGGAYLRGRSVPTNPNSARQQTVRSAFAASAIGWAGLTVEQREAWEGYAALTAVTNRIGESITVSGFNMYVRANSFRGGAGAAVVAAAPPSPGLSELGTGSITELSEASGIILSFLATTANGPYVVSMGPSVSAGVLSFKGPYSAAVTGAAFNVAADGTNYVVLNVSPLRYGAPLENQRRPIRIAASSSDGRLSDVFETIVTVGA